MTLEELASSAGAITFFIIMASPLVVALIFFKKIIRAIKNSFELSQTRKRQKNKPRGIEQNPDNPNNIGSQKR